jgi:hypothetical protein
MNRTIRNLMIAVPLATAALTMTPGVAMADEPTPIIATPEPTDPGDPMPDPEFDIALPEPTDPQGPDDIAIPEPDPGPQGPDDLGTPQDDPTHPDGPGDLTAPKPCPTHGVDCTPDDGDDSDNDGSEGDNPTGNKPHVVVDSVALPTRIDAGEASDRETGMELSWLLASGAIVTASGAAFAARRRARSRA